MRVVTVRGPLALLGMIVILWVAIATIDDKGDRVRAQGAQAREFHAHQAQLVAGQVGAAQAELWRRDRRFASRLDELSTVAGLPPDLADGHRFDLRASASAYVVTVDGFTLTGDFAAWSIQATCDAPAEAGCVDGRWDLGALGGLAARLLP